MIRELKTFVAIAREGSFAATAGRIGLTQAAVSAQMQRLEDMLGFQLFDRTGRSATINAKGLRTLEQAKELLKAYERLGSEEDPQQKALSIRVGAIASAQRGPLAAALHTFLQAHVQTHVRVIPGVSLDLFNRVDAGEIDMAIIIRPPFAVHRDLRWTTLAAEPFRLLVPRGTKGSDWQSLMTSGPFIRYERSSFGGRQVDRFLRTVRVPVNEACELDELDAIVKLVGRGVGVALVPETGQKTHWPADVRAIDLGRHTFHREIGLICSAVRTLNEPVRAFAECIGFSYGVTIAN